MSQGTISFYYTISQTDDTVEKVRKEGLMKSPAGFVPKLLCSLSKSLKIPVSVSSFIWLGIDLMIFLNPFVSKTLEKKRSNVLNDEII